MEKNVAMKRSAAGEQSTMGLYLRELRSVPQLSAEEERACARLAVLGDETARQNLIRANLRFVIMVARRYRNCGVPLEDLVNEGNIGLIRAADRFDPDRGVRFVSYAVWWIRQAVLMAIRPKPAAPWALSLDSPVVDMEDPDTIGAHLEDRSTPKPEEVLVDTSLKDELGSVLARLSSREASILQDRFGLAGHTRATLLDAGRKHGLSKERVRQIEKRALRKIRVSDCAQQLTAYAN